MVAIGSCALGRLPRVVVALRDGHRRDEVAEALRQGADIIEARIDSFHEHDTAYVLAELRKFSGMPTIGTIRGRAEGGAWTESEAGRLALYQAMTPLVDAVDIEIGADAINREVIAHAREHQACVIGSFHDFDGTPDASRLQQILEKGLRLGVDIVKIAAHCATIDDLRRLARFLLDHPDNALVVIGMGPAGMASRIFFPALGSLLSYTFINTPSAPGQLSLEDTLRQLRLFYDFD